MLIPVSSRGKTKVEFSALPPALCDVGGAGWHSEALIWAHKKVSSHGSSAAKGNSEGNKDDEVSGGKDV